MKKVNASRGANGGAATAGNVRRSNLMNKAVNSSKPKPRAMNSREAVKAIFAPGSPLAPEGPSRRKPIISGRVQPVVPNAQKIKPAPKRGSVTIKANTPGARIVRRSK